MKPFLKWVGGKTQILDQVVESFPTEIVNYHEPFLGGGSVLLALLAKVSSGKIKLTGKVYCSDINTKLINVYKVVQQSPREFIDEIERLSSNFNESGDNREEFYYLVRNQFNEVDKDSIKMAAMFVFLNKTCFRGMYRENSKGAFNVPYGNYKTPKIIEPTHIIEVSKMITPVIFTAESFESSLTRPVIGDFVYLDPPYAPETIDSFVAYNSVGFGHEQHLLLFETVKGFEPRGVQFVMSNSNTQMVTIAFGVNEYHLKTILCKRSINSKNPGALTVELLIKPK